VLGTGRRDVAATARLEDASVLAYRRVDRGIILVVVENVP
jgi:hypothetical protein